MRLGLFAGLASAVVMMNCAGAGEAPSASADESAIRSGDVPVAIKVSAETVGAPIDERFAGLSFEKGMLFRRYFTTANEDVVGLFKRLGKNHVRIGGGACDMHTWNANGTGQKPGEIAPADVDALASFLDATGWQVLYCVNLKTGTPELAAAEAAYAARALGDHLVGIEVGNEPNNYGWGLTKYVARWQEVASAVHTAVPSVVITSPGLSMIKSGPAWLPAVLGASPKATLETQHYYVSEDVSGGNADTLLSPAGIPNAGLSSLDELTKAAGVPYRMAETNSYWGGGTTGASDVFASALWSIDYMFAIAAHNGVGANFHTRSPNSSSVLFDSNGVVTQVRPMYYGLLFFTLAGEGRVLTTTAESSANVTAHALAKKDGGTSVFVLNKSATPVAYTIDLGRTVASASARVLTAPSLTATDGVEIQGSSVALDGTFTPAPATPLSTRGSVVSGTLAPAAAALVDVP